MVPDTVVPPTFCTQVENSDKQTSVRFPNEFYQVAYIFAIANCLDKFIMKSKANILKLN